MRIEIGGKLRPFSHRPGVRMLIPFTEWEVQAFPAKLFFRNLLTDAIEDISLDVQGPVKGFTALLDLERGRVEVFGRAQSGYFKVIIDEKSFPFLKGDSSLAPTVHLSLGVNKKQDWDLVNRRNDMAEVFPHWVRLAQMIPFQPLPAKPVGSSRLLNQPELLFQAGFVGILSPRLEDEQHLGLIEEEPPERGANPIGLLHAGAKEILSYFYKRGEGLLELLPFLPKEFHAGRLITPSFKLEWSKKCVKKVILTPQKDEVLRLQCGKGLKTMRLRRSQKARGEQIPIHTPLHLEAGKSLFLDRFQK